MARESRTSLRQTDFLIIRSKIDNSILKIVTPQHFEIGLESDPEFHKILLVNGSVRATSLVTSPALSGSLTQLTDGTSYLREGSNVTIASGSDGSVTISAGSGALVGSLSGAVSDGIVNFSYDGSTNKSVAIDLYTQTGLEIHSSYGLQINPSNCNLTVTTPAVDDYLLIHDTSSTNNREVSKITVANLMTAATFGTLGNPITFGDGIFDSNGGLASYNNTAVVTIAVALKTGGGLNTVSPGELQIKLDGSTLALATAGVSVASVPNALTHGTGISTLSFDGSSAKSVAIDTAVVPRLSQANTFTANNTFNAIAGGSIIGSIQEVSPGFDYLIGGSNVTITKDFPGAGQITIDASMGAGSPLTQGNGITTFSYDGSVPATVTALGDSSSGVGVTASGIGLDATSLSVASATRSSYLFVSDGATNIIKDSVGAIADLADRSELVAAAIGGGISISWGNIYADPAEFSIDTDGSTITVGPGGLEVLSVPYSLSQGLGIDTFSFDGSSAKTVAIDTTIVPRKNVNNTWTGNNYFNAPVYASVLSGSLTRLVDGTTYLREGTNVSISTGSNGAITISAVASSGGLADGNAKYLVLEATGSLSAERVFVAGPGIDTVDHGAGNNYIVSVDLATDPGLQFTGTKLDAKLNPNDTIRKDADGLAVNKVPYGLTQGAGINPFGFDGSSGGAVVAVDGAVVGGRRKKDSYFIASNEIPLATIAVTASDFSEALYEPDLIDILLNGQMLHSGSSIEVIAGSRDYYVASSTSLKFAFALQIDDIIDVVVFKVTS